MNRTGWQALDRALSRLRPHRELLSLCIDGSIIWLAWQATHLFRMGFDRWLSARPAYDPIVACAVVAAYLVIFRAWRLPSSVWRFTGFADIQRLAVACLAAGLFCGVLISPVLQLSKVPRAVLALHPFVSLMGVCLVRLLYRMFVEHLQARLHGPRDPLRPVLVLGAGEAAKRLIVGIQGQGWQVLGLLDDDPAKAGARVAGVSVLGPLRQVGEMARRLGVGHLILAMPSVQGPQRRRIIEQASASGLPLLTVPSAQQLEAGTRASRVRDIEPEDLLGREPVALDETGIGHTLRGKCVLISGAGGSIGMELALQIARFQPARLVLIDRAEFGLYRADLQLRERYPQQPVVSLLRDATDADGMQAVLSEYAVAVVFHAAAYKHVPLVEVGNAAEAVVNNIGSTWALAKAAARSGVERFVLISSDKAVNPTNVMGATKRASELVVSHWASVSSATRFIAVRFGNVLGSSGSVIPRFKEQIAMGGPVTVTHPDVIRYFMTIPEACRLVLQAAALGEGGQVLVLDMGEPVRIEDLARTMIRLSGHSPEEIPIVHTGLRPGEKLFEELLADSETTLPTDFEALRLARLAPSMALSQPGAFTQWCESLLHHPRWTEAQAREELRRWVPEFTPADPSAPPRQPR
ncbi:MAG: polysaccharide biosynthesis protein [Burkholderiaceae bacterium]